MNFFHFQTSFFIFTVFSGYDIDQSAMSILNQSAMSIINQSATSIINQSAMSILIRTILMDFQKYFQNELFSFSN